MKPWPCDYVTAFGMPWVEWCGRQTANRSGWCDEHQRDWRENYPRHSLPRRPRDNEIDPGGRLRNAS